MDLRQALVTLKANIGGIDVEKTSPLDVAHVLYNLENDVGEMLSHLQPEQGGGAKWFAVSPGGTRYSFVSQDDAANFIEKQYPGSGFTLLMEGSGSAPASPLVTEEDVARVLEENLRVEVVYTIGDGCDNTITGIPEAARAVLQLFGGDHE